MADFVKHYIVTEPFSSAKVRQSMFNGYPKYVSLYGIIIVVVIQQLRSFHIDDFVL